MLFYNQLDFSVSILIRVPNSIWVQKVQNQDKMGFPSTSYPAAYILFY